MSHAGPSARDVAAFTSLSVASRKPRATSVRRSFLLWTAVEQKKQRSYASERPYEAHLLEDVSHAMLSMHDARDGGRTGTTPLVAYAFRRRESREDGGAQRR